MKRARSIRAVGLIAPALGFVVTTLVQSTPKKVPDIERLMTAEEFRAAGLQKLSEAELSSLSAWLVRYSASVERANEGVAAVQSGPVIESRIDGEFNGWEGETVFRLLNGQIWQQSSYGYYYRYAYSPKVVIYRSGSGYRMKVDGTDREISVRRLR